MEPIYGYSLSDAQMILDQARVQKRTNGAPTRLFDPNNPRTHFERLEWFQLEETLTPGTTGTDGAIKAKRWAWSPLANDGDGEYTLETDAVDLYIPGERRLWGVKGETVLVRECGCFNGRYWEMITGGATCHEGTVVDNVEAPSEYGNVTVWTAIGAQDINVHMFNGATPDRYAKVLVFPAVNQAEWIAYTLSTTTVSVLTGVTLADGNLTFSRLRITVLKAEADSSYSIPTTSCETT